MQKIKTIKGFDNNLQCRGFQYEIGKTYKLPKGEKVSICNNGFHAIDDDECPLCVFGYYPPSTENGTSRYCEVEVGGNTERNDDKIVGSEITIGAEIGIPGLVKAHIDWVKRHLIDDDEHKSVNDKDQSSASNTGHRSSASNTGYRSSASNTGDQSSAEVSGKDSIAAVFGKDCIVRGSKGCALFLTERGDWNGKPYPILNVKAVIVDGKEIKAYTWYKLVNGKIIEAE